MKNLTEMTTAELVAEYNELTGKSIKKFSSRAAGEKQVEAARKANAKPAEETSSVYGFSQHGLTNCPHCGIHLNNGVGVHGDEVNGKIIKHETHEFVCLACEGEFGAEIKKFAKSITRSKSISESWNVPEVAASRAERHEVIVKDFGVFRSVAEAFRKLNLPLNKHIAFRIALKESGAETFEFNDKKFEFTINK